MAVEPDIVQKIRMCVAEVGGDETAITYPSEQQKSIGVDFGFYGNAIPFKMVWQASQIAEPNYDSYVCWECISIYGGHITGQQWKDCAAGCEAWRPCINDCRKVRDG